MQVCISTNITLSCVFHSYSLMPKMLYFGQVPNFSLRTLLHKKYYFNVFVRIYDHNVPKKTLKYQILDDLFVGNVISEKSVLFNLEQAARIQM